MRKLAVSVAPGPVTVGAGSVAGAVILVGLAVLSFGNPFTSSPVAAHPPAGERPPPRPPGPDVDVKRFGIAGSVTAPFRPGRAQALDVELTNPNNQPIEVTAITVTVGPETSQPGCVGPDNLVVDQQFTGTVVVPRNSTVRLSTVNPPVPTSRWPRLRMPDLEVNQDACKQATFTLGFAGSARRA